MIGQHPVDVARSVFVRQDLIDGGASEEPLIDFAGAVELQQDLAVVVDEVARLIVCSLAPLSTALIATQGRGDGARASRTSKPAALAEAMV